MLAALLNFEIEPYMGYKLEVVGYAAKYCGFGSALILVGRIRNRIGNMDQFQVGKNDPQRKEKSEEMSCFEVMQLGRSSLGPRDKYSATFYQKNRNFFSTEIL